METSVDTDWPLIVAVSIAVPDALLTVEAVNSPLDCPDGTITDAGTIKAVLLLKSVTAVLLEATVFRLSAQFVVAPLEMVAGLQVNEVTCMGGVTVTVV